MTTQLIDFIQALVLVGFEAAGHSRRPYIFDDYLWRDYHDARNRAIAEARR